ncbi:DUF3888 domain-containing protein [Bacillus thuringiensis]|uniref:DUF3888 domain-containing protein n=1 Tax=Bacillus thuringiensis TaxID=1428 RepID=UPI0006972625|nr:DUF3888 domain-containing protein [Bacillus thuringiensis]
MKRLFLIFLLYTGISCVCGSHIFAAENDSKEKLIYDTLLTSLSPYITTSIKDYYGDLSKSYELYDAKINNIHKIKEGEFSFIVKLQIHTYENAHNPPYGLETITFKVTPAGITTLDFKHLDD